MEIEGAFNDYLQNVGIPDTYVGDVEYVDNGSILPIKREIENLRKKVDIYLSLGGQGENLKLLDNLDEEIEILKYLKEKGCVERHKEFAGWGLAAAQRTLECEEKNERIANGSKAQKSETNEILDTNIDSLSGIEFEKICQRLVEKMGFEVKTTKASGDGGIDLIAYNHQPLLSGKYIIQCKRYSGSVGEPIIRDLYGVITSERANKGILMTTGYFTKSAIAFAEGKPIELIDGNRIQELLHSYQVEEESFSEEINKLTPKDIFANNIMIEDDYEKYQNTIFELSVADNNQKRAQFINWLVCLTLDEFADITNFQEKLDRNLDYLFRSS